MMYLNLKCFKNLTAQPQLYHERKLLMIVQLHSWIILLFKIIKLGWEKSKIIQSI